MQNTNLFFANSTEAEPASKKINDYFDEKNKSLALENEGFKAEIRTVLAMKAHPALDSNPILIPTIIRDNGFFPKNIKDELQLNLISKKMYENYEKSTIWKKVKANDSKDFIDRISEIKDERLTRLVINEIYELPIAEEIDSVFDMCPSDRNNYLAEKPSFSYGNTSDERRFITDSTMKYSVSLLLENKKILELIVTGVIGKSKESIQGFFDIYMMSKEERKQFVIDHMPDEQDFSDSSDEHIFCTRSPSIII